MMPNYRKVKPDDFSLVELETGTIIAVREGFKFREIRYATFPGRTEKIKGEPGVVLNFLQTGKAVGTTRVDKVKAPEPWWNSVGI